MPSRRSSIRSEPSTAGAPAIGILSAAFFLAAMVCIPAFAQESPRNIIRWRNDKGDVQQLDVGPSMPRNATKQSDDAIGNGTAKENARDEERRRLKAEREKLELQKEIAELEREIEAINQQIQELRSRQERPDEYSASYESGLEYYLGRQIRRHADKRRQWRLYRDRFRRQHEQYRKTRPSPEPRHRVHKKMQ